MDPPSLRVAGLVWIAAAACGEPTGAQTATTADVTSTSDGTDTTTSPEACAPNTAAIHAAVFEPSCTMPACHGAVQTAAGLELGDPATVEAALVGVPSACDGSVLVVPGDRAASLLFAKISATQPCGDAMPIGAPLPAELVECVGAWIDGLSTSCEQCGTAMCIDTTSDPAHCGGCGVACPAGVTCSDGACQCPAGGEVCGDACVDVSSDPMHCGGCDTPCAMFCLDGACVEDCGDATECSGACVDVTSSAAHCGGCDQPCGDGQSCVDGACSCDGGEVSFTDVVGPLLVAECTAAGCHSGPMPKAGLDLRSGAAYDDLVGVASSQCGDRLRVAPGDPGASYLMHKLRGVDLCSGSQMPKAGQSLAASDLAAIEAWICNGAPPE